jgi:NAD(P)-dependent dehydrogenase (short-subunit alcohol dehydrogenase family)
MSTGWTTSQIPDLSGRTAVVTGANSGLGLWTSLALAQHGAHVVMACRDPRRGDEALGQVRVQAPGSSAELRALDLADLSSVRAFAADLLADRPRIDILVNNAGVMAPPRRLTTADGFELQIGTNHLGHFALTGELLPGLVAGPSRVVTVSSMAHRTGRIDLDDLSSERSYRPWAAYGQSKLANLLFTMELQRRSDAAGADLTSVAAHPGYSATSLVRNGVGSSRAGLGGLLSVVMDAATKVLGQPAEAGAWPSLYAATMPDVRGTEYFGPHAFGGWRGYPVRTTAIPSAYDPDLATALWQRSADLTGVSYDFGPA